MLGDNRRSRFMSKIKVKHAVACCICICCCICCFLIILPIVSNLHKFKGPKEILGSVPMNGVKYSETCWVPEGRHHCAPHFIIAGGMKCGTTSMFTYLLGHPDVLPLRSYEMDSPYARPIVAEKEVRFFIDPNWSLLVEKHGQEAAVNIYLDLFEEIPPTSKETDPEIKENFGKITGEGSPMYICQPGVGKRMKDVLPNTRVIIMLRNPIDRSYSEFWFKQSISPKQVTMETFKNEGLDHEEVFESCIKSEMKIIDYCYRHYPPNEIDTEGTQFYYCFKELSKEIQRTRESNPKCSTTYSGLCLPTKIRQYCLPGNAFNSLYARQLKEWVTQFPREQLMFISSEQFYNNTAQIMEETANFLNLRKFDWTTITDKAFNIFNQNPSRGSILGVNQESADKQVDKYPPLSEAVRTRLNLWFSPHNQLLSDFYFGPDILADW